ncbi:MAG: hypothetical protein U0172_03010 [Nitrospiraceae bacterium]
MEPRAKGDDALWIGATIWYLTVLSLCATAGPGEGIFGALLHALPATVHAWLYAPAAGLLAWLLASSFAHREWSQGRSLAAATVLALFFSVLLEVAQAIHQSRSFLVGHIGWAAIGIVVGTIVLQLSTNLRQQSAPIHPTAVVLPFRRTGGRTRKGQP